MTQPAVLPVPTIKLQRRASRDEEPAFAIATTPPRNSGSGSSRALRAAIGAGGLRHGCKAHLARLR